MIIDVELESWEGSPVIRKANHDYCRIPAASYRDAAARLTPRQGVFYRNLIRIAEAVGGSVIPVDFELTTGERLHLDRGCVKIAELSGFLRPLEDRDGVLSSVKLAWS